MKAFILGFLLLGAACGRIESDAPAGACFHLPSETNGKPDPDLTVWRPCEPSKSISESGQCWVRILDRAEEFDMTSEEVMTKEECYGST